METEVGVAQDGNQQRAYMYEPEFIERQYELPTAAELARQPGVIGVVRYLELPSFEPERLFTLIYRLGSVEVSSVIGASSLWDSLPQIYKGIVKNGEPFHPSLARRRSSLLILPSELCPPLLQSWSEVQTAATEAGDCSTNTSDGVGYRHRVYGQGTDLFSDWNNPGWEHTPQNTLIDAYTALLRALSLYQE